VNIETPEFGWYDTESKTKDELLRDGYQDAYGAFFAQIDPDNVDLNEFPRWNHVPWFYAELHEGDCIYIPLRWYHYVESDPELTITWHNWFTLREQWRDDDKCDRAASGEEIGRRFTTSECLYENDRHGYEGNPKIWKLYEAMSSTCVTVDQSENH
jgi:hypothetical protein